MKLAVKFSITLALVYSMVFLTACPSAASLQKAKDESGKLAGYANIGVNVTRTLWESHVITDITVKDVIATKFVVLAKAGETFDTAVTNAIATYGTNAPKSEIDRIFATFDSQVVSNFIAVLQSLKLVSNAAAFATVIATIETAVLLIAKLFNQKSSVAARLQAAH
jgi:hypothetical protein